VNVGGVLCWCVGALVVLEGWCASVEYRLLADLVKERDPAAKMEIKHMSMLRNSSFLFATVTTRAVANTGERNRTELNL
jgi:hypothetical protein